MDGLRLPTLGVVIAAARRTAARFPMVLASGALAALAAILLVEHEDDGEPYLRLLAAASLGLPLFLALTLTAERRLPSGGRRWVLLSLGVVLLGVFWAAWPGWSEPVRLARYVQLSVAFHLLAAFLPYAGFDEPNGFWHYNKSLFLRALMAGLYAGVLYAGLAVALLALDRLLGVDVPGEGYARLWFVMAFVFATVVFTGGLPDDFGALQQRTDYPAGLRVFTQYVLVPIVIVYLVILTLYLGKVLVVRQWPSGWIGWLVSSVAVAGILAWLLVRPLEDQAGQAWVRTYTRGFYLALLPSVVMLWLAIGKRVAQYGVTERRYFLAVLSLWLAGIALYFTFSRSRSIKVIPATLCLLAFATLGGPWGAYQVSRASQRHRLERLLVRYDLLSNGVARPAGGTRDIPFGDRREMAAGLRYLIETHGERAVAPWFDDAVSRPGVSRSVEPRVRAIMTALGVGYVGRRETESPRERFYYRVSSALPVLRIDGYAYAVRLSGLVRSDSLRIEGGTVLTLVRDRAALRLTRDGKVLLEIPLQPVVERAGAYQRSRDDRGVPAALLRAEGETDAAAALLYLTSLAGTKADSGAGVAVTGLEGELFLRLK